MSDKHIIKEGRVKMFSIGTFIVAYLLAKLVGFTIALCMSGVLVYVILKLGNKKIRG